jgi:hypothetical protein
MTHLRLAWPIRLLAIVALLGLGAEALGELPAFGWNLMPNSWHVTGPIAKRDRHTGELERPLPPFDALASGDMSQPPAFKLLFLNRQDRFPDFRSRYT